MTTPSWDERYGTSDFFYGREPNDFLRAQAPELPKGGRVLCLAEGEGRNAVFLAQLGFQVTAVDASSVGLEKARRLATERGVSIDTVLIDLRDFEPGDESFDAVVSIWCHLSSALRPTVHHRIRRALRPGGRLVLEHYHPRQVSYGTGGPKDVDFLMTAEELRSSFSALRTVRLFEGEREVHEGAGHSGLSFVTQFVAEKPR
jgi:SAM-dependent methyltransferase